MACNHTATHLHFTKVTGTLLGHLIHCSLDISPVLSPATPVHQIPFLSSHQALILDPFGQLGPRTSLQKVPWLRRCPLTTKCRNVIEYLHRSARKVQCPRHHRHPITIYLHSLTPSTNRTGRRRALSEEIAAERQYTRLAPSAEGQNDVQRR